MKRLGTAWLCAFVLASCATPLPPTGGPPDQTPPRVETSTPAPGAVNVSAKTIRIVFSEYVDESSFRQSLSISPAPEVPPEMAWSGRTVEILMPNELRSNTTYVVTLDTGLRDIRGVAVTSPITLAFSTGPTINAGTLSGRVVLPRAADPVPGVDVFAYVLADSTAPDSLPASPAYRTQTDASGTFTLDYLTEQFYFLAVVRDQNRNLAADPQESYASPPIAAVLADTVSSPLQTPWILTQTDTTRPEPFRVQSLSSSRHALLLTEPVRFVERSPSDWTLTDSASGEAVGIDDLYIQENDPRRVLFTTSALDPTAHVLEPAALADTSGNALIEETLTFTPSSAEDTVQVRFVRFLPEEGTDAGRILPRGSEPGIRFNAPIDAELLGRAVTIADSNETHLPFSAVTDDGTTYRLLPSPPLAQTGPIVVRIDGAVLTNIDSTFSATYRRIPASETGEIRGVVVSSAVPVVVEAYPADVEIAVSSYEVAPDSTGVFVFSGLPAGTYRLRAFADIDGNGVWSGGLLEPYLEPEPVDWLSEPSRVRARWETTLPDTLRIRAAQ